MKKITYIAIALLAIIASSCSNIAEDERLIYVEPAKASRNVLIEDFTGQRCVNCPKATDAIHEIQEVYGENVIAVAIHSGPFGGVSARNPGLMNDTGKEYWNKWFSSTQGQPVAKINRGEATNGYENWSAIVADCLSQETDVVIEATVEFDKTNGQGAVKVLTTANAGRKANLQVWLTEDAIVAPQTLPDGSRNNEYVHNHVFRSAVNGTWGEAITYTESVGSYNYNFTIDEATGWIPDNMHAVVFVYDDNGVEQVVQVPVVLN